MQHLQPNTLLQGGKYKIVRFISSGGFGCTYEAEHVMLHKKVAIKEFFVKDFCNRDETTSQISVGINSKTALVDKLRVKFVEEAQSICALEHPNIVHVFDVFEENGTAYYVMDYIDGLSLKEIVDKHGAMPEQKAIGYIKQVADALKYVHSQNRLHLDIKPGNIMIDTNDRAMLIDFGASKQYDEVGGENTSTLLGKTPGYAPLEQMGNDVVKFLPSTDIYALGATLYKLVTGVTPPSASLLASGETLDNLPTTISTAVRNAITMAMQVNKMKRPQSVDEFLRVLDKDVKVSSTIGNDNSDSASSVGNDNEETILSVNSESEESEVSQSVKGESRTTIPRFLRKHYFIGICLYSLYFIWACYTAVYYGRLSINFFDIVDMIGEEGYRPIADSFISFFCYGGYGVMAIMFSMSPKYYRLYHISLITVLVLVVISIFQSYIPELVNFIVSGFLLLLEISINENKKDRLALIAIAASLILKFLLILTYHTSIGIDYYCFAIGSLLLPYCFFLIPGYIKRLKENGCKNS